MKRALFLDRDGILNIDKAYVFRFEDIVWVNGIFDLIKYANENDFLVIVLTNQSGVAQGIYKEEDVLKLHKQMNEYLNALSLRVDDWFYCTEYDSDRRKPRPGMMIEARDKWNIDLSNSYMIGDKVSDILDIEGPQTFLLEGNYPLEDVKNGKTKKSAEVFKSLGQILEKIKNSVSKHHH